MKRYIKSSSNYQEASSRFREYFVIRNWHGLGVNYGVHADNIDDPNSLILQISGYHPYDDAEYAWARVDQFDPTTAKIYKSGKLLAEVSKKPYVEDEWESASEYVDSFIDDIIIKLVKINKDVKPKMMYN